MTKQKLYKGVIDMVADGNAYVVSDDFKKDVFIPRRYTYRALNGDEVLFRVTPSKSRQNKMTGQVMNIVKRADHEYTGIIDIDKDRAIFAADNKKIPYYFVVPFGKLKEAEHDEKVVVKFSRWVERDELPIGEVIRVLGKPGEHHTEIDSILYEFNIDQEFNDETMVESEKIVDFISSDEINKRRDFRKVLTFTIDPDDAKDFDDAISYEVLANGNYEIGVHIADVTHYVLPHTALEKTAMERATSVYLVDRVVPMLPEKISNVLCSLRPNEDKLTFSTVLEMTPEAKVVSAWFGKTIIHSDKRFTYDEVQQIIDTEQGIHAEEILKVNSLAKFLQQERFKHGAINFDSDEIKIKLDENNEPIEIYQYQRKDSHKLIEELMLLANKKVAEVLNNHKFTSVNRVHDAPETTKLSTLTSFAKRFGYEINAKSDRTIAASINAMLKDSEGKPEQHIISHFAIRSMPKAYYSTKKTGHYGLGYMHYSHFTSPIRRYPDMMTHRLLQEYLLKHKSPDAELLEKLCKHSTEKEVSAAEAERASKKYKQMQFLQKLIGSTHEAIISGTTEWGMYAEIVANKCEGMIRLSSLHDDQYTYDEQHFMVIGNRTKKSYKIGDKIQIKIMAADPIRRQADFELAM
ncbi:MAG: ribonuclease R [Bacteroidetes bacterium]|nr:ribonuclease R [Bacteroidota bacterium]